jgi:hypothetical protein
MGNAKKDWPLGRIRTACPASAPRPSGRTCCQSTRQSPRKALRAWGPRPRAQPGPRTGAAAHRHRLPRAAGCGGGGAGSRGVGGGLVGRVRGAGGGEVWACVRSVRARILTYPPSRAPALAHGPPAERRGGEHVQNLGIEVSCHTYCGRSRGSTPSWDLSGEPGGGGGLHFSACSGPCPFELD